MASFEWKRKPSSNFGDVWVPAAVIQLQTARGHFRSIEGYLDSGAVITLLRGSVATELGLSLESGRPIVLSNVGGAHTNAFVHHMNLRFAPEDPPVKVPVAYAVSETVPNLIGRLGVFDRFEITFDPSRRETRINLPLS